MSRTTPGGFDGLLGDAVWWTMSLRSGAKARPEVRIDSSAPHSARVMMRGAELAALEGGTGGTGRIRPQHAGGGESAARREVAQEATSVVGPVASVAHEH